MKVPKDNNPVIYKQDIMDSEGKLNFLGAFLVVGVCLIALNSAFEFLSECIVDKDKLN